MQWYEFVACFFAGMFLANAVPHYVQGISGNRFPTPFAHPPGKGLSSSLVNTLWGLLNLAIGFVLFRGSRRHQHSVQLEFCEKTSGIVGGNPARRHLQISNLEEKPCLLHSSMHMPP